MRKGKGGVAYLEEEVGDVDEEKEDGGSAGDDEEA